MCNQFAEKDIEYLRELAAKMDSSTKASLIKIANRYSMLCSDIKLKSLYEKRMSDEDYARITMQLDFARVMRK